MQLPMSVLIATRPSRHPIRTPAFDDARFIDVVFISRSRQSGSMDNSIVRRLACIIYNHQSAGHPQCSSNGPIVVIYFLCDVRIVLTCPEKESQAWLSCRRVCLVALNVSRYWLRCQFGKIRRCCVNQCIVTAGNPGPLPLGLLPGQVAPSPTGFSSIQPM